MNNMSHSIIHFASLMSIIFLFIYHSLIKVASLRYVIFYLGCYLIHNVFIFSYFFPVNKLCLNFFQINKNKLTRFFILLNCRNSTQNS